MTREEKAQKLINFDASIEELKSHREHQLQMLEADRKATATQVSAALADVKQYAEDMLKAHAEKQDAINELHDKAIKLLSEEVHKMALQIEPEEVN